MNDETAALLDLDLRDRALTEESIRTLSPAVRAAANAAETTILARLGTFPTTGIDGPNSDIAWLTAFVRTTERVAEWHASRGVPIDVTAASLGDVGRHLRLHWRVQGTFGLETWWWLTNHFDGALFQLGRLQFLLREVREGEPRQPHGGGWCLDVHIPDSGPLLPSLVDSSFAQAASFFPHHFPRHFPTGQCARRLLLLASRSLPRRGLAGIVEHRALPAGVHSLRNSAGGHRGRPLLPLPYPVCRSGLPCCRDQAATDLPGQDLRGRNLVVMPRVADTRDRVNRL